jgi:benzoate membrane transport protein
VVRETQPIVAGIVTSLVGFTSSFVVVLAGLRAMGANEAQAASGLLAAAVAMGLASIVLSWRYQMPITSAWSTPGAALLASATMPDGGLAEAIGAFTVAGVLIVVTGFWPVLGDLVARIPKAIAQAMLAGVLVSLCLEPVRAFETVGWEVGLIVVAWLLGVRFLARWAVPLALVVTIVLVWWHLRETGGTIAWREAVPDPVWTTPRFSGEALISIALPLFIVTMASQNVPGVAVLASFGYRAPWRASLATTGVGTVLAAPFGSHAINLAALSAALAAGPEAGADTSRRWIAGVTTGITGVVLGLASGVLVVLVAASPEGMLEVVAGLALLGTLAASLQGALADADDRIPAVSTFLIATSGVMFFGIGAAFWALVGGLAVRFLLRSRLW